MKKVLILLVILPCWTLAQEKGKVGLQINWLLTRNIDFSRDQFEYANLAYSPTSKFYDFGVFGEWYFSDKYVRGSASVFVRRENQSNTLAFDVGETRKVTLDQIRFANTFEVEYGKIWQVTERIHVKTGILAAHAFSYPSERKLILDYYTYEVYTGRQKITTHEGSVHNSYLTLSCRFNYLIASRVELGMAFRYGLWLNYSNSAIREHTQIYDEQGVREQEYTKINQTKRLALQSTGAPLPIFTIGVLLGK